MKPTLLSHRRLRLLTLMALAAGALVSTLAAPTPANPQPLRVGDGSSAEEGLTFTGAAPAPGQPLTLWYRQPARRWVEASVIGNGRLGGMVWGGVKQERIDLNEDTLWSGEPYDNLNPNGLKSLPEILALLLAGQNAEAQRLVEKNMNGQYNQCYLPLGDLKIDFPLRGEVSNYRRELDLETAVARTTFELGGMRFTREVFASQPAQAILVRLTSDPPGKLAFTAALDSQLRHCCQATKDGLRLIGRAPVHADPHYLGRRIDYDDAPEGKGMRFEARLAAVHEGGSLTFTDQGMVAENCDHVTLILVAATSYNGPHKSPSADGKNPARLCDSYLAPLAGQSFAALRTAHVADHQRLFRRVQLDLGRSQAESLPTDVRLKQYAPGSDASLAALYFQFGRYLLIASSRPGTQPANLQGIWNKDLNPAWSANWTLNCNAQINYWPVEVANLAECHEPLIDLTTELSVDGTNIAKNLYGARGWIAHHNTDVWRQAGPVGGSACWSVFQGGSGWLCQHLWEHYAFNGDAHYLRRVWPVLAGAARFYLDAMIEEPSHGRLVTAPDVNFENGFRKPDGTGACSCYGPTATMQMVRELFKNCVAASAVLQTDAEFRAEIERALPRLAPMQISPTTGELQEWVDDWQRTAPVQVLSSWGAICSAQITPRSTPELAAGLRRIFDAGNWWKGGAVGSWQGAFQANLYARFGDGDTALNVLNVHFQRVVNPNLTANFSGMAEWEIDGNLGLTAGIAEMLIQSQTGEIELLPALPKAWPSGSVKGLKARGNVTVDLTWKDGQLTSHRLTSPQPQEVKVRVHGKVTTQRTTARFDLVRDGRPACAIVVAEHPSRAAQLAALELQSHVLKMTGVELPLRHDAESTTGARILVGESAATRALGLRGTDFRPQEYLIGFRAEALVLLGRDWADTEANRRETGRTIRDEKLSDLRHKIDYWKAVGLPDRGSLELELPGVYDDQGTCYATYDFLERFCGLRWYGPTDLTTVIPKRGDLSVQGEDLRRSPALKHRNALSTASWPFLRGQWGAFTEAQVFLHWRRLRLGGEKWAGNHTIHRRTIETVLNDPEYQAHGPAKGLNLCYTHPKLVQVLAQMARDYFDGKGELPEGFKALGDYFAVVPEDVAKYCDCARCRALLDRGQDMKTGFFSSGEISDYWFSFVNAVARELRQTHPDKYLATLAYWNYAYPPRGFELEPNVSIAPCLHTCAYAINDGIRENDLKLYRAWLAKAKAPMFLWNYYHHPMEPALIDKWKCFPNVMVHETARAARQFIHDGVRGIFECGEQDQLEHYVMIKLWDDPGLDTDALLDEFFAGYFGPAARPLNQFYRSLESIACDQALYPPNLHKQDKDIAWRNLGTPDRMRKLAVLMAEAEELAGTETERQRVALWRNSIWKWMLEGRAEYETRSGTSGGAR